MKTISAEHGQKLIDAKIRASDKDCANIYTVPIGLNAYFITSAI